MDKVVTPKTGGGVGTNQYQIRGRAIPKIALPQDLGCGNIPDRQRCGQIWNSSCQVWVSAPDWSHADHPSTFRRRLAAQNAATPPYVLAAMVAGSDWRNITQLGLLEAVGRNPSTPRPILSAFVSELVPQAGAGSIILPAVATNPNTPVNDLRLLYRKANERTLPRSLLTRLSLAANPRLPLDLLIRTIKDRDLRVREYALSNPALPDHIRTIINLG